MNATKKTDAQKIRAIAELNGYRGWHYRPDYSGRGMCGDTCPGITCPSDEVKRATAAVKRAGVRCDASLDSMGLDSIVYWPYVQS